MELSAPKVPCDQCYARRVRCRVTATEVCRSCSVSGLQCTRNLVRKKRGPKPAKRLSSSSNHLHDQSAEQTISPEATTSLTSQPVASPSLETAATVHDTPLVDRLWPSRLQIQSLHNADQSVTVNELANLVLSYTEGGGIETESIWLQDNPNPRRPSDLSPLIQINSPATPGFSTTWPRTTQWLGTETAHSRNAQVPEEPSAFRTTSVSTTIQADATLLATTLGLPLHYGTVMLECVDVYFSHLNHALPILNQQSLDNLLMRPLEMTASQRTFLLAFCAAAKLRYACRTGGTVDPLSRELGCRLLEQCLRLRSDIDYMESLNPTMVMETWFIHLAYACLSKPKTARQFLREGICFAMELGLHNKTYTTDQGDIEAICVARTIALLYITERAIVVLGDFATILFRTPPVLPDMTFDETDRHNLYGFQCLFNLFSLLDTELLEFWFSGSLEGESRKNLVRTKLATNQAYLSNVSFEEQYLDNVQRADLLVTQHWIRHLFWQVSMRAGLLSSRSDVPAFLYSFPFRIGRDLCTALRSLPAHSLEANHFSIYCKIFDVAYTLMDLMALSEGRSSGPGSSELRELFHCLSKSPITGMSFIRILMEKGT